MPTALYVHLDAIPPLPTLLRLYEGCARVYVGRAPGANVVTTEHSDWATNCPEYKVTAVQVTVAHHARPRDLASAAPVATDGA